MTHSQSSEQALCYLMTHRHPKQNEKWTVIFYLSLPKPSDDCILILDLLTYKRTSDHCKTIPLGVFGFCFKALPLCLAHTQLCVQKTSVLYQILLWIFCRHKSFMMWNTCEISMPEFWPAEVFVCKIAMCYHTVNFGPKCTSKKGYICHI